MTYSKVTTEGRPSGTNATKIETANVTVFEAWPLYAVVIPTTKKMIAKMIAMTETIVTKSPLHPLVSKRHGTKTFHAYISIDKGLRLPVSPPVRVAI